MPNIIKARFVSCFTLILLLFLQACVSEGAAKSPLDLRAADTKSIAQGVTYMRFWRAPQPRESGFALASSVLFSAAQERAALDCLSSANIRKSETQRFQTTETPSNSYSVVMSEYFRSEDLARTALRDNGLANCGFWVMHGSASPHDVASAMQLHVIEVDPALFQGSLISALANGRVATKQSVSGIAKTHGALAAINGGFFVVRPANGIPGEPAGISIVANHLVSEPNWGRPAFVLQASGATIAEVAIPTEQIYLIWSDGSKMLVDGINRRPGQSHGCGNPGDTPTAAPRHAMNCSDADEIVVFTELIGQVPDLGSAVQVAFGPTGNPLEGPEAIEAVGGILVSATGTQADAVSEKVIAGYTAVLDYAGLMGELTSNRGESPVYVVNGGPLLLREGQVVARDSEEGWPMSADTSPERIDFAHRWIRLRNPRTAAGVTRDGKILLVTVDGRQPGLSAGASIDEMRAILLDLGAADAINLDGGGSAAMYVDGAIVSAPSDDAGERAVADAILVLPTETD